MILELSLLGVKRAAELNYHIGWVWVGMAAMLIGTAVGFLLYRVLNGQSLNVARLLGVDEFEQDPGREISQLPSLKGEELGKAG